MELDLSCMLKLLTKIKFAVQLSMKIPSKNISSRSVKYFRRQTDVAFLLCVHFTQFVLWLH